MAEPSYRGTANLSKTIIEDARKGVFKMVYLLMGDEPYYPDMACAEIVKYALDDYERDFNETICYGSDVSAETIVTYARRFPMMAARQLIVVREAQKMDNIAALEAYCHDPLDTTVLVLLYRGKMDKRTAVYKSLAKVGVVLESSPVRDYEINQWIEEYFRSKNLEIERDAAAMFGEHAGTDLGVIVSETDKILKNLPEGTRKITAEDIEKNLGMSRQFNVFELSKALNVDTPARALKIAAHVGNAHGFRLPMATSILFLNFNRVLRLEARLLSGPVSEAEKASILGVRPFFFREYDSALRRYPLARCMNIISLLTEYDLKSKSGSGDDSELLMELVVRITMG